MLVNFCQKWLVDLTRICIITNDPHFPFCLPSGSSINVQDKSNLLSFNCFSEYNLSVRKTSVYLLTVGTVLFLNPRWSKTLRVVLRSKFDR